MACRTQQTLSWWSSHQSQLPLQSYLQPERQVRSNHVLVWNDDLQVNRLACTPARRIAFPAASHRPAALNDISEIIDEAPSSFMERSESKFNARTSLRALLNSAHFGVGFRTSRFVCWWQITCVYPRACPQLKQVAIMDRLGTVARRCLSTAATADEVLYSKQGSILKVSLNRPKAMNALTLGMIRSLTPHVRDWSRNADLFAVVMNGEGGKAFCAGGDIKVLTGSGGPSPDQEAFYREEYVLDYMLAESTAHIPQVSIWHGAAMGGGLGISAHSSFRIATEKAVFAMPETLIGFFPDVGGSYFLPRLRLGPEFGLYLGLTGARLTGADLVHTGAATHYLPSSKLPQLIEQLAAQTGNNHGNSRHAAVEKVISDVAGGDATASGPIPSFSYSRGDLDLIRDCFTQPTVEAIVDACEAGMPPPPPTDAKPKSRIDGTAATLRRMSPTSLKITLEQIRRGSKQSLRDCFDMEFRMAVKCSAAGSDFYEGVDALLVRKDNKPTWNPARLEDVSDAMVQSYFQSVGDKELRLPRLE